MLRRNLDPKYYDVGLIWDLVHTNGGIKYMIYMEIYISVEGILMSVQGLDEMK
jgi:hypothetical protein